MVQLFKCNRCDFTNEDEDSFAQLAVALPIVQQKTKMSNLPQKWANREDSMTRGFAHKQTPHQTTTPIHYIDLCPKCTIWFQSEFDLKEALNSGISLFRVI